MAYRHFDPAHPDPRNDNGVQTADYTRFNLLAVRDAVVQGLMYGWDEDVIGPDPLYPERVEWTNGVEMLKTEYSYDADGFTSEVSVSYSSDSGTTWNVIGVYVLEYNAEKVLIGGHWQ